MPLARLSEIMRNPLTACSKWPSSEAAASEKAMRTLFGTLSL
jgi:hypothetical protein